MFQQEDSPRRSAEINLLFSVPRIPFIFPPSMLHLLASFIFLSFNMLREMRRNIISHHKSRDRPNLWLLTRLQPSLAGQGSGAKAINHTQTIHVEGTRLHCSKNEKKTHSETDGRLEANPSITGWRLHKASRRKHTRR